MRDPISVVDNLFHLTLKRFIHGYKEIDKTTSEIPSFRVFEYPTPNSIVDWIAGGVGYDREPANIIPKCTLKNRCKCKHDNPPQLCL